MQFQGMIAEYERAQILERTRRGKTHRAKAGHGQRVVGGAVRLPLCPQERPRRRRATRSSPHEAAVVAEMFRRYADGGVAIAELTRWLGGLGVASRTGKTRWDRSVVWGMLRNPAYAGRACFGKTMRTEQPAGLNRHRAAGRAQPPRGTYTVVERPREDWLEIPVPALVAEDTWHRVQRRLDDNKRYASRNSTNPSLLQGSASAPAAATPTTAPRPAPPTRSSTTTGASALMTTATSTAGSAPTSRSAPTTSTPSSGTTSATCSPTRR